MTSKAEKERLEKIKKRFKRINIINTLVICVLMGCYAIGFFIYQSVEAYRQNEVLNHHVTSSFENRRLFIETLYGYLSENKHDYTLREEDFYNKQSVAIRFGRHVYFYAFSNQHELNMITSALVACWEDNPIIPSEVFSIVDSFIHTCENSRNIETVRRIMNSLGIENRSPQNLTHHLVVSETTRYELTLNNSAPYNLVLLASPRGSMRNFNFSPKTIDNR